MEVKADCTRNKEARWMGEGGGGGGLGVGGFPQTVNGSVRR